MMHHCAAGGGGGTTRGHNENKLLDANVSRPTILEYVNFEGKRLQTRYFDVEVFDNSALRKRLLEEKNNGNQQDDWPVVANLKDDSSEAETEDEPEDEEEDRVEQPSKFNSPHHVKFDPVMCEFYLVGRAGILNPPPPNRYYYESPPRQEPDSNNQGCCDSSEEQEPANETCRENTPVKPDPQEVTNKKRKRLTSTASSVRKPNQQRRIETRSTDVLGGSGKGTAKNPGNVLFRKLMKMHLANYKRTGKDIVTLLINQIHKQEPPGRFFSPDNQRVLTGLAEQHKVMVCLSDAFARSPYGKCKKGSKEIAVEARKTDVLGGRGTNSNPGNILFPELIQARPADYRRDGKAAVDLLVNHKQNPPGRILSSDNEEVLTGAAARKRVAPSLAAVSSHCHCSSQSTKPRSGGMIVEAREQDVLGGRENGTQRNPGNVLFRQLQRMHFDDFNRHRNATVELIIQKIHKQNGRFLSSDNRRVLTGPAEEKKVLDCMLARFCQKKNKAT